MDTQKKDKGFTLVELLIVIVILGILSTVTVFAVRGITTRGQESSCRADFRTVQTAAEAYAAQYGTSTALQQIPTTAYAAAAGTANQASAAVAAPAGVTQGASPMATLVSNGFLKNTSTYFWVQPDGSIFHLTDRCNSTNGTGTITGWGA